MPPTSEAILDALAGLALTIERAACAVRDVRCASYPGGARPSAVVTLAGSGAAGRGEHVAWTREDHERFAAVVRELPPCRGRRLGDWVARLEALPPYERAALEAAAIDLALRQAGTNLFRLAGVAPRPVRYVVSFDRRADPAAELRRLRAASPGVRFKIDVDVGWDDGIYAGLDGVDVLDFKLTGRAADQVRAHAALPDALLEDPPLDAAPWPDAVRRRISLDAPVRRAADVAALPFAPAAVNVKPARMGGVFEALRTVAACAACGIAVYVGGMFEVGVGRRQLHDLAALLAPEGPNDVAPLDVPPPWPARIAVAAEAPGFGRDDSARGTE